MLGYISKQLINPADAEDVFQRTSIILWEKTAEFDIERNFFSWACGIAYYEICNFLRVQNRDRLYFDVDLRNLIAEESIVEHDITELRHKALEICINELKSSESQLIQQCYQNDASIKEIADTLGRTHTALYKHLERIRTRLINCVERRLLTEGHSV